MNKNLYKVEVGFAEGLPKARLIVEAEAPSRGFLAAMKFLQNNPLLKIPVHEGMPFEFLPFDEADKRFCRDVAGLRLLNQLVVIEDSPDDPHMVAMVGYEESNPAPLPDMEASETYTEARRQEATGWSTPVSVSLGG